MLQTGVTSNGNRRDSQTVCRFYLCMKHCLFYPFSMEEPTRENFGHATAKTIQEKPEKCTSVVGTQEGRSSSGWNGREGRIRVLKKVVRPQSWSWRSNSILSEIWSILIYQFWGKCSEFIMVKHEKKNWRQRLLELSFKSIQVSLQTCSPFTI